MIYLERVTMGVWQTCINHMVGTCIIMMLILYIHIVCLKQCQVSLVIRKYRGDEIELENFFGFLRIKIQVDGMVHKPLAIKRSELGLTNPVGSWTGLYFSEEVKAYKNSLGYKIEIIEGDPY